MQSIIAEKRDILGKKVDTLRRRGFLPAVIYPIRNHISNGTSGKNASIPVSVKEADFFKLWKSAGESSIVEVKVGAEKYNALVQDVAMDPLKDKPVHADFYVVEMDKPIKVDVPLEFIGESEAVRVGGILVKVAHEVKIEALPKDLPHSIAIDISMLKNFGDSLSIKDLKIPQGIEILNNPDETVVLVEAPRSDEEIKGGVEEAPADLGQIEVVGKKAKEAEEGEESGAEKGKEEKGKGNKNKEKNKEEKKKEEKK